MLSERRRMYLWWTKHFFQKINAHVYVINSRNMNTRMLREDRIPCSLSVVLCLAFVISQSPRARLRPETTSQPVQALVFPAESQSFHVGMEIREVWVDPLPKDGNKPKGRGAFVAESRRSAHMIIRRQPTSLLTAVIQVILIPVKAL